MKLNYPIKFQILFFLSFVLFYPYTVYVIAKMINDIIKYKGELRI